MRKRKELLAVGVVIMLLFAPFVHAKFLSPLTVYQSTDWSIKQGSTLWKERGSYDWELTSDESIFTVSITSTETKTVTARLMAKQPWYRPDIEVAKVTLTGQRGSYSSARPFVPDTVGEKHYPTVETNDRYGAQGRVSVQ